MIDKLTRQTAIPKQAKGERTKRVSKAERPKTPDTVSDDRDLIAEIAQSIDYSNIHTEAELQKALIVKALTNALGDKFAMSPHFKRLYSQIEDTLSNDENTQFKLREILKSKVNK